MLRWKSCPYHQVKHLTISHQVKLHQTSHSRTTWSLFFLFGYLCQSSEPRQQRNLLCKSINPIPGLLKSVKYPLTGAKTWNESARNAYQWEFHCVRFKCTSNMLQMCFKCASNVLVFIEWDNIHFITYLCVFELYACMFGNITDNTAMKIASILCSFVKEKAEYCVVYLGSSVSLIALQSHASRLSINALR